MKKTMFRLFAAKETLKDRLRSNKGAAYVQLLVEILIAVVIGALILTLLYALVNTIWPELTTKIMDMFNFGSTSGGSET